MKTILKERKEVTLLLLIVALSVISPLAAAQRAMVGDLVEFTSGLGPTLAEIVVGPDASGYVIILTPTGDKVPVNTSKLRLIQKAGTPNAAIKVGESVGWVDGGYKEKGTIVKVNGKWCQVKSESATTIGWIECKAAVAAANPATPESKEKPAPTSGKAHNVKLEGNWENADGMMKLEFQPANKCYISAGPMTGACTYKKTAKGVSVMFDDEELALTANDDGSLSGDPDAMMPMRFKRK